MKAQVGPRLRPLALRLALGWDYAYKNGGKVEIDAAYKEARKYHVGLSLPGSLTSDSQKARVEIYDKVKQGTTNEQK